MNKRQAYWLGERPSNGRRWAYTEHGLILSDSAIKEAVFQMYRRYVKQWNDIELDTSRCLSEHTHEICGAKIVGGDRRFILDSVEKSPERWILEILFSRGFSQYYPGLSCGLNTLRTLADIQALHLHWNLAGNEAFIEWLKVEKELNGGNGQWKEYKATLSHRLVSQPPSTLESYAPRTPGP